MRRALYSQLVNYYDRIYWWKDYKQEVDFVVKVLRRHRAQGKRVLEVACGTGNHTKILLEDGFEVTGLDISEDMLRIARRKLGRRAKLVRGDMRDLDSAVRGSFDVATCLFSAISYNETPSELRQTLQGLYDHLVRGGIVVFDTHFTKKGFVDGHRGEDIFDDGRVFGARLGISKRRGNNGQISFSYLIKDGARTLVLRNDVHRFGLFDQEDFLETMRQVGFVENTAYVDWTFRRARGQEGFRDIVFVGVKPSTSA